MPYCTIVEFECNQTASRELFAATLGRWNTPNYPLAA